MFWCQFNSIIYLIEVVLLSSWCILIGTNDHFKINILK